MTYKMTKDIDEAFEIMHELKEEGKDYTMEYHEHPYQSWRTNYDIWEGFVFYFD
ncbi:hypothetical protein AB1283_00980 [Bacillus sp. S13(2024)]|uniref:hypothetical protein n=1 Tax=Bacillus sp. S13(2024) TaxID=3162885 RepID=UPI003D247931